MDTYIAAFVVFVLVVAGMAVGVIFSDLRIKGSCGGLASLDTGDGAPMCACGARPGQTCGADPERRFDLDVAPRDDVETADTDEGSPARRGAPEAAAV